MQQLLPDVSPLVNILQKAGQEKRDKAEREDAVNHAMFMDAPDNDSFMALIGQQMNQGLIDAEEAMMYEQLAAMPIEQRNKSIARDLISGGFQDLVFDKGLTGQQTRNMGKSYSPDVVYKPTGEKDKDGNPINQAFYAFSGVDANGEPYVKYQQIEGELGGSFGRSAADEIALAAEKTAAVEAEKFKAKGKYAPKVIQATKLAEWRSKFLAEDIEKLSSLESGMQGIDEMVTDLSALADDVSYTFVGKAANYLLNKGFGIETEGGTARVKWTSIVDNEILPLLKQTFGAAFTAAEGERLKATLGSEDYTTKQKMAALESFVSSKRRQVEGLRRKLGNRAPKPKAANQGTAQGNGSGETKMQNTIPPVNAQGWKLMKDANGNYAYVSPDGQFEEVQ